MNDEEKLCWISVSEVVTVSEVKGIGLNYERMPPFV